MKAIFSWLFLCLMKCSFASVLPSLPPPDTITLRKEYNLNEKEFLDKYGRDDSSRALIHFYFKKRRIDKRNFYTGAGLSFIGGMAVLPVKNLPDMGEYNSPNYNPGDKLGFTIGIVCFLVAGIPLLLIGGSLLLRYKRKRLAKLLDDYFAGKFIPKGIAQNKYFKMYMKLDKASG